MNTALATSKSVMQERREASFQQPKVKEEKKVPAKKERRSSLNKGAMKDVTVTAIRKKDEDETPEAYRESLQARQQALASNMNSEKLTKKEGAKAFVEMMMLKTQRSLSEGGVHFKVRSGGQTPYWEQANESFLSDKSMIKRAGMRWDKAVLKQLEMIWDLLPKERELGKEEGIGREAYLLLANTIHKYLIPSLHTDDISTQLEKEWTDDSGGKRLLSKQGLFNTVFDVADTWCPVETLQTYVAFLTRLCRHISSCNRFYKAAMAIEDQMQPLIASHAAASSDGEDDGEDDGKEKSEEEEVKPEEPLVSLETKHVPMTDNMESNRKGKRKGKQHDTQKEMDRAALKIPLIMTDEIQARELDTGRIDSPAAHEVPLYDGDVVQEVETDQIELAAAVDEIASIEDVRAATVEDAVTVDEAAALEDAAPVEEATLMQEAAPINGAIAAESQNEPNDIPAASHSVERRRRRRSFSSDDSFDDFHLQSKVDGQVHDGDNDLVVSAPEEEEENVDNDDNKLVENESEDNNVTVPVPQDVFIRFQKPPNPVKIVPKDEAKKLSYRLAPATKDTKPLSQRPMRQRSTRFDHITAQVGSFREDFDEPFGTFNIDTWYKRGTDGPLLKLNSAKHGFASSMGAVPKEERAKLYSELVHHADRRPLLLKLMNGGTRTMYEGSIQKQTPLINARRHGRRASSAHGHHHLIHKY